MNKDILRNNQVYFDTSRLLVGKTLSPDIYRQTLVVTIRVNSLQASDNFKKSLYNRLSKLFYGKTSANHKHSFSMLMAADVEGSRYRARLHDTLLNPLDPHYHCIMVFSKSDWTRIEGSIPEWSSLIAKEIKKMKEVKPDKIYIAEFDRNRVPDEYWASPLMHFVEYCSKSSRVADMNDQLEYQSSIFPYDLLNDEKIQREQQNIFHRIASGLTV